MQETHLTADHQFQLDTIFSRYLTILNLSDPTRPSNSAGIAFILNKELTNASSATVKNILNVYAPNNANEQNTFWKKIKTEWERIQAGPLDFMLGEFNLTENPIDCAPARLDNEAAVDALRDLKSVLNMQDTWHNEHPHHHLFTFNSNHQILSRLDRIYTLDRHTESMLEWALSVSQILTDHHMVSVRFAPLGLPHTGKGRWSWPVGVITDDNLIKQIIRIGIETQQAFDKVGQRTNTKNPQMIWKAFKSKITNTTKDTTEKHLAKINQ
ncbi:uncharacterized protein HD556DRAFT_1430732 [Suillus plorans]|uniref:Endonuclease/exonuclease/phosphatase domain-containing protein n=1 Tax=Suillus plorans TaxID=116603 RepID=A0A9P7DN33_9AGAM|nr:uncharacterized protein HD556DRAFT_1430732 [Suillus plorans]KAG1798856.1 hypothetical protein HD556DRAFT_1430732 [Suillus plorans]